MPLSEDEAIARADQLRKIQEGERHDLDTVRRYWKGRQRGLQVLSGKVPREVREMARMARVNVCEIVVESLAQSLFVDGFRTELAPEDGDPVDVDAPHWQTWQANRMDKHQSGLHRATVAYGTGYEVVWHDPRPLMRPVSPRLMTAVYGDEPDWPDFALEQFPMGGHRLYDDEAAYTFIKNDDGRLVLADVQEHPFEVTPVVRFNEVEDLDADDDAEPEDRDDLRLMLGQVAPLRKIQDQIDMITFNLLVAQHYSAFRQRLIIGWVADEEKKLAAAASQLWTIDADPSEVTATEFAETTLDGYIRSREASLKYAATLSQTPVHELIGELINMSADALAAAEAGRDRKVGERKTNLGESHEQTFQLVGTLIDSPVPDDAQVVWRDTSSRAFSAVVDALGKLAQMLGVPPQELWEQIPGVTQQDVRRWKAAAAEGDSLASLEAMLDRQAASAEPEPDEQADASEQADSELAAA